MAKILKVRNQENTEWIEIASSVPDTTIYLTESSASTIYATIDYVDNEIENIDALPSQSGHAGEFLTTSGSVASWASVDALPSQTGNNGKYLTTDGNNASWDTIDLSNYATEEYVQNASANVVSYLTDLAPAALDTLNELAAALGDDENFSTTITNSLSNKLDISSASSTYLTQIDASETYLEIGSASTTYATKVELQNIDPNSDQFVLSGQIF